VTYLEATSLLLELPRFSTAGATALNSGLDRMTDLLRKMGSPHRSYPTIHVAGTNGKGSTASMVAAMCTSAGIKTGLHTSPHLLYIGERMRIDGTPSTREWLSDAVGRYKSAFRNGGVSFFEATAALSLLYFKEYLVDIAIIETGLGGRLDATNVILPTVSVITGIARDHEDILGGSLREIAAEKAGIIKPGVPVVVGPVETAAASIISEIADQVGAPLTVVDKTEYVDRSGIIRSVDGPQLDLDLPGEHQVTNAVVATRAFECAFADRIGDMRANVSDGLTRVRSYSGLRARLEVLCEHPNIVIDVSHNADAIQRSIRSVATRYDTSIVLLLALFRDKNVSDLAGVLAFLRETGALQATVLTFSVTSPRAYSARDLALDLERHGVSARPSQLRLAEHLDDAVRDFDEDQTILVTGSHLLASEALTWKLDHDNQSNIHTRE